ncbi:MAG: hypothetical protein VE96_C0008G0006 [candidate division Kazan bacterium GW2011_GWA1_44_22]|uniref:Uncharacterized protein n=1 Tax=candidate division Kazan bacterium GW2011_GWA1_44_22 TaxID=1620410 RepID=A0A0G1I0N3_UNCK3|nr:MAG: hypothetical protein VE96_C0008G0006 [candidate division Kazan bacterium GW2011_GWA1_44_22]
MGKRGDSRSDHHDLSKARGGQKVHGNIVQLWRVRHHDPYHLLFEARTFLESAMLLRTAHQYRINKTVVIRGQTPRALESLLSPDQKRAHAYRLLFRDRSFSGAAKVFLRVTKILERRIIDPVPFFVRDRVRNGWRVSVVERACMGEQISA